MKFTTTGTVIFFTEDKDRIYDIVCLSAIETLICRREISLIGSASFRFAQNTIHDFQNTVLN